MTKPLNEFRIGEAGVVKSVSGEGKIKRRLFDMGITNGAEIRLRKKAPLGDMYTGITAAPPLFNTFAHIVPVITDISLSLDAPPNTTAI